MIKKKQLSNKPCSNYLIKTFYENDVALKNLNVTRLLDISDISGTK